MTELLEALSVLLLILIAFNIFAAVKLRRARKAFLVEVRAFKGHALEVDEYRVGLHQMVLKVSELTLENARLEKEVRFAADLAMRDR